jgi:hypothetical protein
MTQASQARAFVFPGQGSQAVGMGQALAESFAVAREVFEEVDDALSQPLWRLMKEGPIETLTLTENAQPALMAVSMAVVRVLEREGGLRLGDAARFVAGHSLGEYSALAAAGTFSRRSASAIASAIAWPSGRSPVTEPTATPVRSGRINNSLPVLVSGLNGRGSWPQPTRASASTRTAKRRIDRLRRR